MATLTEDSDAIGYIDGELISATDLGVGAIDTDVSSSLINLDDFRAAPNFAGIDGSGFSVVVIDTGIDLNHPFFGPDSDGNGVADRIVYDYDFADGDAVAGDLNGHGSNVISFPVTPE